MVEAYIDFFMRLSAAFATIYIVALGHSLFELSGLLNLSIDGMFFLSTGVAILLSAFLHTLLIPIGVNQLACTILATILTGLIMSLVGLSLAWILSVFPISQGAVGLSLMFLGYGLGIQAGYPVRLKYGSITQFTYPQTPSLYIVAISLSIIAGVLIHRLLYSTPIGAMVRACGEDPHIASNLGAIVYKVRLFTGAIGYFLIGIGGSLFPLLWLRYWDIRSYALGYGWFAYTVALAAGRHPILLIPFALIFGGLLEFNIAIQASYGLPVDLAGMMPFIASIVLMMLYSSSKLRRSFEPPRSLGKIYYKEERTI
ncbi:MAG: ribose ABC transporter permease [Desulfurococcaceae archaeon]